MLVCVSFLPAIQSYAQYSCNITPIGGGGFVTGVIPHQTSGDIYCRTDVEGAYRWDASKSKRVQLMDWLTETQKGFQEWKPCGRVYISGILGRGLIYWDLVSPNSIESEIVVNDMVIYPNPTRDGKFSIKIPLTSQKATIHIFDNQGRMQF